MAAGRKRRQRVQHALPPVANSPATNPASSMPVSDDALPSASSDASMPL
jgi:hypothetical protein